MAGQNGGRGNSGLIQKAAGGNGNGANTGAVQASPLAKLKGILGNDALKKRFEDILAQNAGPFISSIIDLYNNDNYLQMCDPNAVVMEALKAASLKLPINKQLGFAWIVPYRGQGGVYNPTFQIGYKGYIQLCMRTGAYKYLNADVIYEGELVKKDKLTGWIELDASAKASEKKIGYFAYMETLNGFSKTLFMTVDEVTAHARKYSKSFSSNNSAWSTDFDAMAMKTCLRLLLGKYGVMSVEMQQAFMVDNEDALEQADRAITDGQTIDINPGDYAEARMATTIEPPLGDEDLFNAAANNTPGSA